MIKVFSGLLLAALIAIYFLYSENEILAANYATMNQANSTNQKTIKSLKADSLKKQQSLKEREASHKQALKKVKLLASKLDKELTKDEKECYEAVVPDPVIVGVSELFNAEGRTSDND